MSEHPVLLLEPFYKWLDWVIATYGLEIYMVTVWLSPLIIVWILRGGFWRRPPRPRYVVKPPPLPKRPVATPPPLPQADSSKDDDSQSFPA